MEVLLKSIGCWLPTCHICQKFIGEREELAFVPSGVWIGENKANPLFAGVHATCEGKGAPSKPPEPTRGHGCFLTAADLP